MALRLVCFAGLAIAFARATSFRSNTPKSEDTSASALIADAPFAEVWSQRYPYDGLWSAQALPSNWTSLPCTQAAKVVSISGDPVLICLQPQPLVYHLDSTYQQGMPSVPAGAVFHAPDSCDPTVYLLVAWQGGGITPIRCRGGVSCVLDQPLLNPNVGTINSLYSHATAAGTRVWVSGSDGIVAFDTPACIASGGPATVVYQAPGATANAFAYSETLNVMTYGNATKLMMLNATSLQTLRWVWVTNITSGEGAPIDDNITSLAFMPDGTLYIGNPTCLNARYTNGTFVRSAGPDGLPYGNITSLAVDQRWDSTAPYRAGPRLWIGTTAGAILFDPEAVSWTGRGVPASSIPPGADPLQPRWRYFYGPRYFPSHSASEPFDGSSIINVVSIQNRTFFLTTAGVATFTASMWTLADKVAWFESQLPVFDLFGQGLVGDCNLAGFGAYPCTPGPNDNNGLWTSLVVAGESMRYALTGSADAAATATHFFEGMRLLNDVTGIHGLIARSALPPQASCPTTDPDWHKSTSMPGYCFKGTASSDEVVGHTMAHPMFSALVGGPYKQAAAELLINMTMYIINNNFSLVDVTGQPTQWGHWSPDYLNGLQSWSDGRGLNSLQMLTMINAALALLPANSPSVPTAQLAYTYLAINNQYLENTVNTRINAPCDINYSDDELTFFTYAALFFTCRSSNPTTQYGTASIQRSWFTGVGALGSNLWGGIYLASTQAWSNCSAAQAGTVPNTPNNAQIASDIVWNLRTWSPDLISWPVDNTARLDVVFNTQMDRFGNVNDQSMTVLPQYERNQARWNANPYELGGGGGTSMSDPGVFLYPYWLARYIGVLSA